jgi:hypothetical protein
MSQHFDRFPNVWLLNLSYNPIKKGKTIVMSRPMKDSMTNSFQGRDLSSHKPLSLVPCTSQNLWMQETAVPEQENFPPKNSVTFYSYDATISPETTVTTNHPR